MSQKTRSMILFENYVHSPKTQVVFKIKSANCNVLEKIEYKCSREKNNVFKF